MTITLSDGKVLTRLYAGYIASEDDLARFVAELRKELACHEGETLMVEVWEYVARIKVRKPMLPNEAEELSAA